VFSRRSYGTVLVARRQPVFSRHSDGTVLAVVATDVAGVIPLPRWDRGMIVLFITEQGVDNYNIMLESNSETLPVLLDCLTVMMDDGTLAHTRSLTIESERSSVYVYIMC
jgi:hypothetical protein